MSSMDLVADIGAVRPENVAASELLALRFEDLTCACVSAGIRRGYAGLNASQFRMTAPAALSAMNMGLCATACVITP